MRGRDLVLPKRARADENYNPLRTLVPFATWTGLSRVGPGRRTRMGDTFATLACGSSSRTREGDTLGQDVRVWALAERKAREGDTFTELRSRAGPASMAVLSWWRGARFLRPRPSL